MRWLFVLAFVGGCKNFPFADLHAGDAGARARGSFDEQAKTATAASQSLMRAA